MSRAPNVTFRLEEFGDLSDPPTVERFLRLLNTAMHETSTALGGGLVVGENVAGFVKTLTFAALPVRMRNERKTGPTAILVGRAEDVGPAAPAAGSIPPDPLPVSLGSVGWAVSKGEIVISALSGLDAARKYRVTFLVLS